MQLLLAGFVSGRNTSMGSDGSSTLSDEQKQGERKQTEVATVNVAARESCYGDRCQVKCN